MDIKVRLIDQRGNCTCVEIKNSVHGNKLTEQVVLKVTADEVFLLKFCQ